MKKVLTLGVVLTTMLWTMGLAAFVPTASAETLSAGDLFKTPDNTAVYYYAEDGTKYVFPTASTYFSWYPDFEGQTIKELDSQENMAIDLAGNVMMRAGTKLIQFIDDTGQVISNKIYAVEPDGVLRHLDGEAAAEALYGADWSDKIVKVSQYLFDNYTVSSEALDGSEYPEGSLVSKGDTTYYVNEDGSWSEVTAEGMTANNFMTDYVEDTSMDMPSAGDDITNTHEALVDVSQGGGAGDGGSVAAGTLGVALNANTPATGVVPTNASAAAANVVFTKVDLTAGADAVTVTGLKVTRGGLSNNAAVDTVKLYDGSNQIGSSQSLNSSNQAVFNNISVDVSANETKVLTIAADMTASASYDGNIITLGIEEASDVTTTAAVSGSFPVTGNSQTLNSGITIGSALLYDGSLGNRNGTDLTVDTDATDVRFVQVKVKAGSAEGITINQVTAVKNGTAAASDVKNIRLVNDDTGETLGTVNSLNSSGRAIFNTDVEVSKGDNVELSILADMNKSGAGRTLTFDLHDGTNYTIDITGNTYGYGITPTRSNFCLSGGTCTAQSINQGYLTASLSADTPATGNVALGSTEVPLLTYDVIANGEDINVTQTQIDITTVTAERDQVTQVTIYDEDGKIVAGPKDCTTASAGTESLTFTDAYTIPNGETSYTVKADLATDMTANDDVYAALKANGITAKGADSGKTTYTTSTTSGGTVPPTNVITGKTQTIRGPKLDVNTAATPVASTFVVNSQDVELAYFDLNATAGGEDIKVSQIVVTDTKNGSAAYADWGNLELWGDPDNTDDDNTIQKLETTSNTATGGNTNTFTFKTPIRVSKDKTSRLTLKADLLSATATTGSDTHTFNVNSSGDVTAVGWETGETANKSATGDGQAHQLAANGALKVTAANDRAEAAQFVAGTTGNSMMSYKIQATKEEIDVTELYVAVNMDTDDAADATGDGTGDDHPNANIDAVKLYIDGEQIGSENGYTFDNSGKAHVVLDSGVFVAPKEPNYATLDIKVDLANKDNLYDAEIIEIGLGDSGDDASTWDGQNGVAIAGTYGIVATGKSSGTQITNVSSDGTGGGNVVASYHMFVYDGILTVDANTNTPSGTATPGNNKEVMAVDFTATGDDISVQGLEFCLAGTATNNAANPTGTLYLKSSDLGTTYSDISMALSGDYDVYWDNVVGSSSYYFTADGTSGTTCVSFGDGTDVTVANSAQDAMEELDTSLVVSAGSTKTVKLIMDTTGIATNETLQVSLDANSNSSYNVTEEGVIWKNSSGNLVGDVGDSVTETLTKNLPVYGGSLVY